MLWTDVVEWAFCIFLKETHFHQVDKKYLYLNTMYNATFKSESKKMEYMDKILIQFHSASFVCAKSVTIEEWYDMD